MALWVNSSSGEAEFPLFSLIQVCVMEAPHLKPIPSMQSSVATGVNTIAAYEAWVLRNGRVQEGIRFGAISGIKDTYEVQRKLYQPFMDRVTERAQRRDHMKLVRVLVKQTEEERANGDNQATPNRPNQEQRGEPSF